MIEFTKNKQDFEQIYYTSKNNYNFANQTWYKNYVFGFYFPTELQASDFVIQKLIIDNATGVVTWADILTLDNSKKQTGYFEAHEITPMMSGFVRIKSNDFVSKNIIKIAPILIKETFDFFVNERNEYFINNLGEKFIKIT